LIGIEADKKTVVGAKVGEKFCKSANRVNKMNEKKQNVLRRRV